MSHVAGRLQKKETSMSPFIKRGYCDLNVVLVKTWVRRLNKYGEKIEFSCKVGISRVMAQKNMGRRENVPRWMLKI